MRESDGAAAAGSDWSLHTIQKVLWSRRWLILAIAAEVFIVVGLVTFLKTPLYEASARLVIERNAPKVLQGDDVMPTAWNEFEIQRFYQTQYLLLKDVSRIRKALDREGLREALAATMRSRDKEGDDVPNDTKLAALIKDGLKVEQVDYSNIVKVSFRHPSPEIAARVVNAVVDEYKEYFVTSGLGARKDASEFLKTSIVDATAEVKKLEKELNGERGKIGSVLPSSGGEFGKSRLDTLDGELTAAKARLAKAEAKLNAYRSSSPDAIDEVRSDKQVLKYRDDLTVLRKELAELEGRVGAGWPRVRELKTAVAATEATLKREERLIYDQVLDVARSQADQERRGVQQLSSLLQDELQRNATIISSTSTYEQKRQEYEQKKQALDRLLARREEVQVASAMKTVVERQVEILERAQPPIVPAVPKVKLNLALGLAFGLFLGVAAAFLAEALDNKVRSGGQLAELTRLPLLGSIPRLEGPARPRLAFSRKKGSATPVMAARAHDVEEAFRAMRSSLLLAQPGHPPRTLLITSALPGEGKSTVAANLARTLAAFGHKTVIIDCDLRHPRLHRVFKRNPGRGLTNVLANSVPIADVMTDTEFENLSFIPGGPCPPDPATLLDVTRVRAMVAELLTDGFEFVLIDTPPVMVFADTFNLLPAVEGVILVARAQLTPKEALRSAFESLRKVKAPLIGAVLNGEVTEEHGSSYYRYYHYRRGYYRKAAEDRAARNPEEEISMPLDAGVDEQVETATRRER